MTEDDPDYKMMLSHELNHLVNRHWMDQFVALDFSTNANMTLLLIKALQTNSVRQQLASPFISKTLKKRIKMIAGKTNSTGRFGLIVVI